MKPLIRQPKIRITSNVPSSSIRNAATVPQPEEGNQRPHLMPPDPLLNKAVTGDATSDLDAVKKSSMPSNKRSKGSQPVAPRLRIGTPGGGRGIRGTGAFKGLMSALKLKG